MEQPAKTKARARHEAPRRRILESSKFFEFQPEAAEIRLLTIFQRLAQNDCTRRRETGANRSMNQCYFQFVAELGHNRVFVSAICITSYHSPARAAQANVW
jgi:hypothetical protein